MGILNRIARAIVRLAESEDQPRPGGVCLHEEEDRIDARRMGHPTAFICRRCGYRSDA